MLCVAVSKPQSWVPGVVGGDGVGVQTLLWQILGQVSDKLGVALARFVQLGGVTLGLVVGWERDGLHLLHLEPVHRHL